MIPKYCPSYLFADVFKSMPSIPAMERLKNKISSIYGIKHVIFFDSARRGIEAIIRAIGGRGKALMSAYNCIAVPEAVIAAGWEPRFADISDYNVNVSAKSLESSVAGSKVVILTHQFGIPSEIDKILEVCRRLGLFVLEDAAAAIGARYNGQIVGTFGDASVISFHLTKVIGLGRGGAVLTNDTVLAKRIEEIQYQKARKAANIRDIALALAWRTGCQKGVYSIYRGIRSLVHKDPLYEIVSPRTSRSHDLRICSEYIARFADRQFDKLNDNIQKRQSLAGIYSRVLKDETGIQLCEIPVNSSPSWIQFPLFVEDKDKCYRHFLRNNVDLSWTFRYSCAASYKLACYCGAERAARTLIGLPTYPSLSPNQAFRIAEMMIEYANNAK